VGLGKGLNSKGWAESGLYEFGQTLSTNRRGLRYRPASPVLRIACGGCICINYPINQLKETPMSKLLTALLFAAGAIALPAHAASHAAAAPMAAASGAAPAKPAASGAAAKPAAAKPAASSASAAKK
jgi:hypothetical protein